MPRYLTNKTLADNVRHVLRLRPIRESCTRSILGSRRVAAISRIGQDAHRGDHYEDESEIAPDAKMKQRRSGKMQLGGRRRVSQSGQSGRHFACRRSGQEGCAVENILGWFWQEEADENIPDLKLPITREFDVSHQKSKVGRPET